MRNCCHWFQAAVTGSYFKSKGSQYISSDKESACPNDVSLQNDQFNLCMFMNIFHYFSMIYETRKLEVTADSILLSWLLDRFDQIIGIMLSILFPRENRVYHVSVFIEAIQGMTTMEHLNSFFILDFVAFMDDSFNVTIW